MLKALRTGKITPLNLGFSSLVEKRTLQSITDTIRSIFPHCEVLSDGDDLSSLEARVDSGDLDGALVTLPIEHRSDLMFRAWTGRRGAPEPLYWRNDYAGIEQWSRNIVGGNYVHLTELHKQHEQFAKLWDSNLRLQGFAEAFEQQPNPCA